MFKQLLARKSILTKTMSFLAFVFFFSQTSVFGAERLSPKAQISLITITPGSDLYSAFGHSTLWILDTEKGIDRVYNYGTFDFDQPNFYLNFVKGHLDYTLTAYTFEEQYLMTQYEGRGLSQQILNLDSAQKQRLYDFMEWNSLPENMHYLYDFYLDNCSSRLRDVLQNTAGEALVYDKTISTPYSFRDWMNICLIPHPWSALFMNIGLGSPADKQTDYSTQMYLPVNLKLALSSAKNNGQALVKAENELLAPIENAIQDGTGSIWIFSFGILFIAIFFTYFKGRFLFAQKVFDFSLITFSFVLGTVLLLLWCCTDHWVCAGNTDLLWANPLCISYFFLNSSFKKYKFIYFLSASAFALSICYLTIGHFLPEKPIHMLFPLILGLQIRIFHLLYIAKKTLSA